MKQWVRALLAFLIMIAVSGLVRIYGLEDVLFFNKRFISAAVFFLAFFTLPAAAADWRKKRRTFWISCGFSAMLSFTEILGMSLRLDYAAGGVVFSVGSVLWMAGSALLFGLLLEPLMGRLREFLFAGPRLLACLGNAVCGLSALSAGLLSGPVQL